MPTSRLIRWFDFWYFVRDMCKTMHRMVAMATSAAAANTFTQIESPCIRRQESSYTSFNEKANAKGAGDTYSDLMQLLR